MTFAIGAGQAINFDVMVGRIKFIKPVGLIGCDLRKKYEVKIKIFSKIFQMRHRRMLKWLFKYQQRKGIPVAKNGKMVGRMAGADQL